MSRLLDHLKNAERKRRNLREPPSGTADAAASPPMHPPFWQIHNPAGCRILLLPPAMVVQENHASMRHASHRQVAAMILPAPADGTNSRAALPRSLDPEFLPGITSSLHPPRLLCVPHGSAVPNSTGFPHRRAPASPVSQTTSVNLAKKKAHPAPRPLTCSPNPSASLPCAAASVQN